MIEPPDTKLPLTSEIPRDSRLAALKALIPEAFSEGKIDFDKLKSALGDVVETSRERYGLTWAGKSEAIRAVQIPSKGTLAPMLDASVNFDESRNVIIEGDNLEVLKLLQKSYYGSVKMIYIDPPYNTGNEFIYPDNFREGLEDYLIYSGQRKDDGTRLSTNEDQAGRKHSKWLNMMYPRLFLARNLLKEDGIIFVSIDDNEVLNLKAVMNEIFGEENFLANIVWQKRTAPDARATIGAAHDSILVYARIGEEFKKSLRFLPISENRASEYQNPDDDPRGRWASVDLTGQSGHATPSQFYEIEAPSGVKYSPPPGRCWAIAERTFLKLKKEGRIWFGKNGDSRPRQKKYLSEAEGTAPWTWWANNEVGHNQEGRKELMALLGDDIFDTPKPARLVKRMIEISVEPSEDALILDFFAGSGTTAQAVLELNNKDGGNRHFILVQLPEKTDRADYPTIADITRERIRRVIDRLNKADEGKLEYATGSAQDRGFKAFRLTSSNFKIWDSADIPQDAAALEQRLETFTENFTGKKEQDVLFELILKSGFPLTAKVEKLALGQSVYAVEDKQLYICLADPISPETLTAVVDAKPERFICLDAAFEGNDQLKTNTVLQMRDAGIAFYTA